METKTKFNIDDVVIVKKDEGTYRIVIDCVEVMRYKSGNRIVEETTYMGTTEYGQHIVAHEDECIKEESTTNK